ncbi:LysR family transcriptional regulator [Hyphomicrobium sp.]|uniref:LysR family transcriptional regulator n=1 Tax=Hyphomicrobium sp. TaxID=82 RepID=UPI002D7807FF|nr:LysR family transcriptional regulator [Hyphomicrobium sp.]HET6389093.1 LysR family transcriptional regulator [Hyphomicrobium sp.]
MDLDTAAALRAFVRTVERGSVTAAARDLGVSQPAITKHLRNLEREVGARLLERSARGVRTTPLGQNLFDASRPALATIEAALEGVSRDMGEIDGLLRIHAPSCIGAKHIHRIVTEFQSKYPRVTVDLFLEDRRVDIVYDNFDLSLKYGRPDGQDIIIRRIGHVRRILVTSPRYKKRFGEIKTLKQLAEAQLITTAAVLTPRDALKLVRQGKTVEVPVKPIIRTNNAQVLENTLLSGRAVGPIQELLVAKDLAAGQLIRILPEYEVESTDIYLALSSVRHMRPSVRAFVDFAVPALRSIKGVDDAG